MAVGTAPQSQYDIYIHDKLEQAQARVRFVEIGTGLLLTIGFVLAYLMTVAVVDHWLMPLTMFGRAIALLGLVGGTAYIAYVRLWPPIANPIDPAFAASAIERKQPTLKNSVLNYWFLRNDEARVHRAVLQAVEERAATDLSGVSVEVVVDRKGMMRLAVVVGVIFVCVVGYAIFSPKSPFQTAARVALPFAGIHEPTRVQIEDLTPGDATIPFGTTVDIAAKVTGLRDGEKPILKVTRPDGSVTQLQMAAGEGRSAWTVTLSDEWLNNSGDEVIAYDPKSFDAESASGLRQSVSYQVVAGDAASLTHKIELGLSPTVAIQNVHYDYPPYTGLRSVDTKEEYLEGPEGTKVIISVEANYPLKTAELELDRSGAAEEEPSKRMRMSVKENTARAEFYLNLAANRRDPEFTHYRVHVTTEDGFQDKNPVRHRIRVSADLDPEITRQLPKGEETQLRQDDKLQIVFRASDPDYALTDVRVHVAQNGREILVSQDPVTRQATIGKPLLEAGKTETGQFIGRWQLDPKNLKLAVGDQVLVWATAEDNRQVPAWTPEPNTGRSTNLSVTITAPRVADNGSDPANQDPPNNQQNNPQKNPQQDPQNPKDNQDSQNNGSSGDSQEGNSGDMSDMSGESGDESGDVQSGENSTADSEENQGNEGSSGMGNMGNSGSSDETSEGNDMSQEGSDAGGMGTGSTGQSDSGEADSGMDPMELSEGGNSGNSGGGTESSDGESTDAGGNESDAASGGNAGNRGGESNSNNAGSNSNGSPTGEGSGESADGDAQAGETGEGGSEEPLHDGEIIERINEYARRKEEEARKNGNGNTGATNSDSQASNDTGSSGNEGSPNSGDMTSGDMSGDTPSGMQKNMGDKSGNPGNSGNGGENPRVGEKPEDGGETPMGEGMGNEEVAGGENNSGGMSTEPGDMQNGSNSGSQGSKPMSEAGSEGDMGSGEGDPTETMENGSNPKGGGEDSGDGMGSSGESGAGNAADSESGSGESQGENQQRSKDMNGGGQSQGSDASSPSGSNKQSDSQGGEGGDRSGGGDQGAGQSSGQEGNDSAGSSSPGDSGSGAAEESGMGETADRAGNKEPGGNEGGSAGPGQGSRSTDQAGDNSGGKEAGDSQQGSSESGKQPGGNRTTGGGGVASGDGDQRGNTIGSGELPPAEKAKLEYAKKATDLALETLKNEADPELLKDLGMSADELAAWKKRIGGWKNDASNDPVDLRKYEENLRSLGLKPDKSAARGSDVNDDTFKGIRENGVQSSPPPGYADGMRSFRKRSGSK